MTSSKEQFLQKLKLLKNRVCTAAQTCGRNPEDIKILPVTKFHPLDAVRIASEAGFKAVGENRVQEAVSKIAQADFDMQWELIGHLQSNKVKLAVKYFSRIQSVDSLKLAQKLNNVAIEENKILRILLEVNAGSDPAKFGTSIEDTQHLLENVLNLKNLKVEGLMTIAPLDEDLDTASRCFANLRNLRDTLQESFKVTLPELSMGMSQDLERAVAEGSTMIRVGTFLFGKRD